MFVTFLLFAPGKGPKNSVYRDLFMPKNPIKKTRPQVASYAPYSGWIGLQPDFPKCLINVIFPKFLVNTMYKENSVKKRLEGCFVD